MSRALPPGMRDQLSTLDLLSLASVTGGSSKRKSLELTLAMNQLKSSLSSLKEQAAPGKNDAMLPMVMMMMMRGGGGGGGGAPAQAAPPEAPPAPATVSAACSICRC